MIEALTSSAELDIKKTTLEEEVMILFNGPAHHYVTPKFYTETKPSTGKVVSTWNYSAVQVYGTATVYYDTAAPEFLTKQLDDLAVLTEEKIMGYTGEKGKKAPWTVKEAPENYISLLKKAIVGVEIEITRMAGKFKMSQELAEGDRDGAIRGFRELGTEEGEEIARTIEVRAAVKKEREGK